MLCKKALKKTTYLIFQNNVYNTRDSKNLCNILVRGGTFRQLQQPRSWRWRIPLDYVMPSSPDTLRELSAGFVPMVWSMISEFIVSSRANLAWLSKFLQSERNSLNHFDGTMISCAFNFQTTNVFGWFGLFSLFNGISTLMGYSTPRKRTGVLLFKP